MSFKKLIFLLFLLSFKLLCSQQETFKIKNFVTDKAEILTTEEQASLEKRLLDFEVETTNQIVIVTITSLKGAVLEEFSNDFFEENGIGQEKEDNGVLILIIKEDRKLRIEVGYGLESLITDAKSSRIIREIITPNFKKQNYYKGIDLAVTEVIALINNTSTLKEKSEAKKKQIDIVFKVLKIIGIILLSFFLIFIVVIIGRNFIIMYPDIINSFRGLLVGKVVFSDFLKVFLINVIGIVASLGGLLFFGSFPIMGILTILELSIVNTKIESILTDSFLFLVIVPVLFITLVLIPFLIAFFNRRHVKGLPINILYTKSDKSDKEYLKKYLDYTPSSGSSSSRGYSSSGSSSYSSSSYSSSSSSSSSFSGGGGSSGGGGASGSW